MPSPCLDSERGTSVAGMIAKGCDSATRVVREEFEVKESAAALRKSGKYVLPPALTFVAVRELDVRVLECN